MLSCSKIIQTKTTFVYYRSSKTLACGGAVSMCVTVLCLCELYLPCRLDNDQCGEAFDGLHTLDLKHISNGEAR